MLYVLDASALIKCLLPEPLSDRADLFIAAFRQGTVGFLAPDIIHAEVGHSLRKYVLRSELSQDAYFLAIKNTLALDLPTVMCAPLVAGAADLALKHGGSFYDALYLQLAFERDCHVLTADDRMVRAYAASGRLASLGDTPIP